MKSLRKVTITMYLLGIFTTSMLTLNAQNQATVLESLQAKKWEMQGMTDKTSEIHYQSDIYTVYLNGEILCKYEYYLSDSIDEAFNREKIGKISNGKYIISQMIVDVNYNKRPVPISVYEIVQLNKNWLIFRYTKHSHVLKFKAKE